MIKEDNSRLRLELADMREDRKAKVLASKAAMNVEKKKPKTDSRAIPGG